MKKIYTLLLSSAISSAAFSQALPNPSFDNWTNQGTYEDPDNWNTLNSLTSTFGAITAQKATGADVHTGPAAIKLITLSVLGQNANGLATTGTINVAGMTVDGGLPYTLRPDSITGWYKCDPQGNDFGFVDFTLLDAAGTDTVGFAHFQSPTVAVTNYTYFSIAINYYNANTPALARCVMSSSAGITSVVNSVLIIDDLALVFNPDGVREPVFGESKVLYDPSNKRLHVFARQPSGISVIDMTGQKVYACKMEAGSFDFILPDLRPGLYVYVLTDEALKTETSGRFIAE